MDITSSGFARAITALHKNEADEDGRTRTARELADISGIGLPRLRSYLNGTHGPTFDAAYKLAKVFEITLDDLAERAMAPAIEDVELPAEDPVRAALEEARKINARYGS